MAALPPEDPNQLGLFEPRPTRLHLLSVEEIFATADGDLLTELREDRRLERKTGATHQRVLADYSVMWANTAPEGGLIVVGQEDKGEFTGCSKLSQAQINDVELTAKVHCPDAKADFRRVPVVCAGGRQDFVILIRVYYHPTKLVEDVRGDAFIRLGDEKHKLSHEEKLEIRAEKGEVKPELEPAAGYDYPDDFDTELVAELLAAVRAASRTDPDRVSDVEILRAHHLGTINAAGKFIPNLGCVALFARDPRLLVAGCTVRFLRYEGDTEQSGADYNVVKDEWIKGNIPTIVARISAILQSQLRTFSRVGTDGRFYAAPEYPPLAWHEAIVNACAHRSYGALRNMHVFVKMFDSRLEITSPGGFPPAINPQNIYTSQHSRNPFIMDALFALAFVRCINEGAKRMRDEMLAMNLPLPEFAQKEIGYSQVRVTLRNNKPQRREWVDRDVADIVGADVARTLTEPQRLIVNHIAEYGQINVTQAAKVTRRRWHTEKKLLDRLVERGILERVAKRRAERNPDAYYVLRKPKPEEEE